MTSADAQRQALRDAEAKAWQLIDAAVPYVQPGTTETELNDRVWNLANEMFGVETFWHKRIVRAGPNTMAPYAENPPDQTIAHNDIVFFDFGPVFATWEADVGKTCVVGGDPEMLRIAADIETCWALGKAHFEAHPDLTGAELFAFVKATAEDRGWTYLIAHAGHLVGRFPHEQLQGESRVNYIHPDNQNRLLDAAADGTPRDWILELHFVHPSRPFGAFFEQLLTA